MGVYLPIKNYSAMQGPCPSGFHVPLQSERNGLITIMNGLGYTNNGDAYRIKLHLPFAGSRFYYNLSDFLKGSRGIYASSSYTSSGFYAILHIEASSVYTGNGTPGNGTTIRCFSDTFIKATSSWTVIDGTLGGAGIFWNSADGIISITSDGNTGYTIADKNLGATAVYNDGDALNETNCGKVYQIGNNYAFPYSDTVSDTSTSQVNANNYGPGNYYNSSTFIKSQFWDNSNNQNLRGGVTGVNPMSELKNAYIGEYINIYDFQNLGDLGWTAQNFGYYTPYLDTGEGWTIYGGAGQSAQGNIVPPQSVYDGKELKKIKIYMYKGGTRAAWNGVGVGLIKSGGGNQMRWSDAGNLTYDRIGVQVGSTTYYQTANIDGEVEIEIELNTNSTIWTINGNQYTTNNVSSTFKTMWQNKELVLTVCNWNCNQGDVYLRRVEIFTE